METSQKEWNIWVTKAKEAVAEYERVYEAFFHEQAGILAKDLEEGMPCPVCGSTHHPSLAKMAEDAPSEEEVKKARKKRTEAEEHREQSERQYMEAKSAYDTKRQQEETEIRVLLAEAAKELELTSKNLVYSGKEEAMAILEKNRQLKQQLESSVKRHRKSYRRHRSRKQSTKGRKNSCYRRPRVASHWNLRRKNSGKESCRRRFKTQRTDCGSFIPHRRSMSVSVRTCKSMMRNGSSSKSRQQLQIR